MIEAGAPSTGVLQVQICMVRVPPRVVILAPITRSHATQREGGRKAKAAFSNRGGLEQRGKLHTHYKGRDALEHNSEPDHLGSCMAKRGGAMQEFSEVRAV